MADEKTELPEVKNSGRFPKGVSGNAAGRPPSARNQVAHTKAKLELAVRNGMSAERIGRILTKLADMAEAGDKGAIRIILDKFISSASTTEDVPDAKDNAIRIVITNATFAATKTPADNSSSPIDAEFKEIKEENQT